MALDADSLLRLLLVHRGRLLGYVTSIVRDAHLAEDVFQSVALIVLKKGGVVQNAEEFPIWIRKVARLEALGALRKQAGAPQPLDETVIDLLEGHWRASDQAVPLADALRACLEAL